MGLKKPHQTPTLRVTVFLVLTAVSGIFSSKNSYFFSFCEIKKAYNSVKCNVQV